MPYTFGDAELDCDLVDVAIEVDVPLPSPAVRPASTPRWPSPRTSLCWWEMGLTLQLGIGEVPDSVLRFLRDRTPWACGRK